MLLVFGKFYEVEVVAAICDGFCSLHGTFGNGKESEAGRHGERFLAACEKNVDAEFVHRDRLSRKGRHRINNEHHVRKLAQHGGDFGEGVANAAGGFVVDEGEGIETTFGEFFAHHLGFDGFAPRHL